MRQQRRQTIHKHIDSTSISIAVSCLGTFGLLLDKIRQKKIQFFFSVYFVCRLCCCYGSLIAYSMTKRMNGTMQSCNLNIIACFFFAQVIIITSRMYLDDQMKHYAKYVTFWKWIKCSRQRKNRKKKLNETK